jgi:hypothetical protein
MGLACFISEKIKIIREKMFVFISSYLAFSAVLETYQKISTNRNR